MKMTTRKMTALQTTPRSTGLSRPLLLDAPEWFNRARAAANQMQMFRLRPVPPGQNCFVPYRGAGGRWGIRNKAIFLGLSLTAVPIVFLIGFWMRGVVAPAAPLVANADLANIDGGLTNAKRPKSGEQPQAVARRRRPPKSSTIAATQDTDTPLLDRRSQIPAAESAPDPVDGFVLQSPVAGQFVADVQVPENSWFSLAGAIADCDSGTCKLVPVKTADRKLNTALEWSSTPQAAAKQADREGKLVFLIHVSGNFAQPGFT